MASNSELSEMKLLLQSLAPGLKAAKSDVAELKKSQSQSQQSNSTCANAQTPALYYLPLRRRSATPRLSCWPGYAIPRLRSCSLLRRRRS
ncbi:hypothetical protein SMAC4_13717 [Sordaria macrospora]|uniref:uncharacterized protein n=1 Tax=Sordaria macrospora TaxID=5147 RepID=UPI002B2F67F6|nr:hypothetical protein SMAC4_13583 [Sordaria macrospora]WPJ64011.1 hypothetical protein SMAC4_13717 [Sordaria macrospora]